MYDLNWLNLNEVDILENNVLQTCSEYSVTL